MDKLSSPIYPRSVDECGNVEHSLQSDGALWREANKRSMKSPRGYLLE